MKVDFNSVFKNSMDAETFKANGFVLLNLKNQIHAEQLEAFHAEYFSKPIAGLYASHNENTFERNLAISEKIEQIIQPVLDHHFKNIQYILGHYMIKAKNTEDEFQLHQDWSVTEESKSFSAHLWIPLQDTKKENGAMFVVPGSHLFYNNYRSGSLDIPRIKRDNYVDKMIIPIEVNKGECLVYHPGLFHGSFGNNTEKDRLAVLVSLIEQKDTLKYYHQTNHNPVTIDVYNISSEFILKELVQLEKGQFPKDITPVNSIKYDQISNSALTSKMVYDKFNAHEGTTKVHSTKSSFFKKIFG